MNSDYDIISQEKFDEVDDKVIRDIVSANLIVENMIYGNERWGTPLKNYAILTYQPECLKGLELNKRKLHFNRYYWLKKFYYEYAKDYGADIGIEQQIFFVVEVVGELLDNAGVDELEKIDKQFDVEPG